MRVVLHPTDKDATFVLGPSEGALGGQDAPGRFLAYGRNAYPSGAKDFFADALRGFFCCRRRRDGQLNGSH